MTTAPATATPTETPAAAPTSKSSLAEAFNATADLPANGGDDADIDGDDLAFFNRVTNGGEEPSSPASSTEKPAGAVPATGAQPEVKAPGEVITPSAAAPSGATPKEEPKSATQEAAPKPAEATPAAAATEQPKPAEAPVGQTPEEITKAYTTWREDRVKALAEQSFSLTKEQIELVQTEPEKVIPHLMASAALTAMEASTHAIFQALPQIIQNITEKQGTYTKARETFFGMWPMLKENDPVHKAKLTEIGQLYRKLNPSAPPEEFAKTVGALAVQALGLMGQQAPQGGQPALAPAPTMRPVNPLAASAPRHQPAAASQPAQGSFEELAKAGGLFDPDDEG